MCRDAFERCEIGHTNQDDVWSATFAAQRNESISGVVGLNDLLGKRKILPDEEESVAFRVDLMHGRESSIGHVGLTI